MCIRDRRTVERQAHLTTVGVAGQDQVDAVVRHGVEHATVAVSYTHLRAHETVLDLVCRLLLEKKKKIKQNHMFKTIEKK